MDQRKIGARIKQARKSRGLTQAQLAEQLNLTPKYISNFETGVQLPKLETFIRLANALHCGTDTLLFDVLDAPAVNGEDTVSKRITELPIADRHRILRTIDFLISDALSNQE